jgi:hypothetical protein
MEKATLEAIQWMIMKSRHVSTINWISNMDTEIALTTASMIHLFPCRRYDRSQG